MTLSVESKARLSTIRQLVLKGLNNAEIGRRLTPPIGRERVRQIRDKHKLAPEKMFPGYITLQQYAQMHRVNYQAVIARVKNGLLQAIKMGKQWFILPTERKRCKRCKELLPESCQWTSQTVCDDCKRKVWKKTVWRRFYREKGLPLTPSLAYTHPLVSSILRREARQKG